MSSNMYFPWGLYPSGNEGSSEPKEEVRPSIEQCSVCAKKFKLPDDLKGPQRLIPVHVELFSSRCGGSGKPPKK